MRAYAPALDAALGRYLRFGGLPAAVAEAASGARRELDVAEVKYREHPTLSAAAAAARAHPGRPVVMATKSELKVTDRYTLLPAHTLLWALG